MNALAIIAGLMAAFSMGFALWDHNFVLAMANMSTIIWTILYLFKP